MQKAIVELLVEKSALLKEYFSISISKLGFLTGLPKFLENYEPQMEGLPMFLFYLATRVILLL
jgi:DNA mismatch repair protein MLH1